MSAGAASNDSRTLIGAALWRRLDTPGHDACTLEQLENGWRLEGAAVFLAHGAPVRLTYTVACAPSWITLHGEVRGWYGERRMHVVVERGDRGVWSLNGTMLPHLEPYLDLDLGFTPATNLTQIRRIQLREGESAEVPVAWLDPDTGTLSALPQTYARRSADAYWYEAPTVGYRGLLELDATGFIRRYPGLWESALG